MQFSRYKLRWRRRAVVMYLPVDLSEYLADYRSPLYSTADSIVAVIHALTGPRNCVRSRLI
jgi:hypothetical protein